MSSSSEKEIRRMKKPRHREGHKNRRNRNQTPSSGSESATGVVITRKKLTSGSESEVEVRVVEGTTHIETERPPTPSSPYKGGIESRGAGHTSNRGGFFRFSKLREAVADKVRGKTLRTVQTLSDSEGNNEDDKGKGQGQTPRRRRESKSDPDIEAGPESDSAADESEVSGSFKMTSSAILANASIAMQSEGSFWNVLVYGHPVQRTRAEEEEYRNLIYTPSSDPVKIEDKLPDSVNPRYPEDEGIFVGEPLKISKCNKNRLEQRILKENSLAWFGTDGELLRFPDPYQQEYVRPRIADKIMNGQMDGLVFVEAKAGLFPRRELDPEQNYEITLIVGSLHFDHHPLFSKETVLAARLEDCIEEYNRRQDLQSSQRAENKIAALRLALSHAKESRQSVKEKIVEAQGNEIAIPAEAKDELIQSEKRIQRYRVEMRKMRSERDQSLRSDRECIERALNAWKDLKTLRELQDYTDTGLKLNIIAMEVDFDDDRKTWNAEIEQEYEDLREEFEGNYEMELKQYRNDLKNWRDESREKNVKAGPSRVRAEKPFRAEKSGKDHGDASSASDDEELSRRADPDLSLLDKPVPPITFDAVKTRDEIHKRFQKIKRLPGVPKIALELVKTTNATIFRNLPEGAPKRRKKAVGNARLHLVVIFNGQEVYQSKMRSPSSDFNAVFDATIPIVVRDWPQLLTIQIWEGAVSKSLIAEIPVPLPSSKTSVARAHAQKLTFSSDEVVKTNHTGVGCGIRFEILGNEYAGRFTAGHVTIKIGWSVDADGNTICPTDFDLANEKENNGNLVGQTFRSGSVQQSAESKMLDPNNPLIATFTNSPANNLNVSLAVPHTDSESCTEFSLDGKMAEFDFCTMESLENNPRFRLLNLRDQRVPEFRSLRMIPTNERDISASIFDEYETRVKEEATKHVSSALSKIVKRQSTLDASIFETNRLEKIKEVRLDVLQLFENSVKQITFEDLVIEEKMPDIGTLGLNLMTIFQPKRPLRPNRKERKRIQGTALIDTKINLVVNIVRAFNLPIRRDTEVGMTTESIIGISLMKKRPNINSNYSSVKPFAEVWFQRNVCRTTTAMGSNPTWNQELQLGLKVSNEDFSQSNLSKMDDLIYLHVFDEVAIDLLEDDRRRDTDIHQRLQKRWLGSITIPFSTLYTNGRIEGTFKLNSPPLLLGYEQHQVATDLGANVGTKTASLPTSLDLTKGNTSSNAPINYPKNGFITLFITLQPTVSPISNLKVEPASGETAEMFSHVKAWQKTVTKLHPGRIIKPIVMSPDGDTVLCTRYLKPIEPPKGITHADATLLKNMEDLAHYVSLFPAVRDSTLGISAYSLWFTSDAFVMTPGGGIEDHAVLLACYFMYLKVPCWLVQGSAIPGGLTTFVASCFKYFKEDNTLSNSLRNVTLLWNPCSGEYYTSTDNYCPLHKVWSVIGKSNIWANMAAVESPNLLDWDIEKSNQWLPLFSKPISENKLPCIQFGHIKYKSPDQVQANSLAQRIERFLKESFMKWRRTSNTSWNRSCSGILRRLLPRLEENLTGAIPPLLETRIEESETSVLSGVAGNVQDEHLIELREITTSYKMTGFPLQQPFMNFESLAEVLFATGVHTIDAPHTEFALATYSKAYPASVYSVWIYIASLHRER